MILTIGSASMTNLDSAWLDVLMEPRTFEQVMNSQKNEWVKAMKDELQVMEKE